MAPGDHKRVRIAARVCAAGERVDPALLESCREPPPSPKWLDSPGRPRPADGHEQRRELRRQRQGQRPVAVAGTFWFFNYLQYFSSARERIDTLMNSQRLSDIHDRRCDRPADGGALTAPRATSHRSSRAEPRSSDADGSGPTRGDSAARCGLAVSAEDRAWLSDLLRRGA